MLAHRSEAFSRAKPRNRARVREASEQGRLRVVMNARVTEILPDQVIVEVDAVSYTVTNDIVIVCTGGILPTSFLREAGVLIETKFGRA